MKWMVVALGFVMVFALGCTTRLPSTRDDPRLSLGMNDLVTNATLPNFVIRLSTGEGPTRTNLTVGQGLRLTLVALNGNFTIENGKLGILMPVALGTNAQIVVAPRVPGTYVLRCTRGCPSGKDVIWLTTRDASR